MRSRPRPPRRRSIRALLALLFVVPLVSLLALWGFAASVTLLNALHEHNFTTENRLYGGAAQNLGLALAQERSGSFVWLSSGRKAVTGSLVAQRQATSAAVASFQKGIRSSPGMMLSSARPALASFSAALGRLDSVRAKIDAGRMNALAAFEAYNTIIDAQFRLYSQLIVVNDVPLYQQAAASLQAGRALEMADREVTLINGALAAGGQMSKSERLLFAQTVAGQRLLMGDALKQLDPSLAAGYQSVYTSPAYQRFSAVENRVIGSIGRAGPIPVNAAEWSTTSFSLLAGFNGAEQHDRVVLAQRGTQEGDRLLLEVLLAGGLGLVAVALSVFLMARFGRRISRELTGLQRSALDLATERLPRIVEQLSHGEDVDASAQAAPPVAAQIAEIAMVAEAFSSVQHTAVEAAVGQARLRRGVAQVFRNLAWRSQTLLHRQLAMLDQMERSSTDPGTLEDLFQLDHLTTRMRRHAEGLIILSGEAPGRGWHQPVPVVDVLRAAVAEVEDFTRVSVITRSGDAVIGSAVADVIHLLAELIENATTNSPASTEVTVRAERVANGVVVEVDDRGLGMSEQDMAAANERLANPPQFDLADSDKLGFFVIARLAVRHEVKITLRSSPYGGLAAIVLLPHAITVAGEDTDARVDSAFAGRLQLPPAGWETAGAGPGAESGFSDLAASADLEDSLWSAAAEAHAALSGAARQAPSEVIGLAAGARPPAVQAVQAGQADPVDPVDPGGGALDPGLPRRVRETSDPPQASGSVRSPVGEVPQRGAAFGSTAEELGALAASLQQGWLNGSTDAAEPDEG
ncbi:MAG TPA: nitrate- and nitrite sensing domain-containing protein [Streptosporangiaceae bacterium]|nr:nitrate- and nitrite sensing domain-containing protein [Streptosporangiaceae bacterium]